MLTTLKHRNLQAEQYESREKEYKLENEGNVEQRNKNETKKLKEDTNFHL